VGVVTLDRARASSPDSLALDIATADGVASSSTASRYQLAKTSAALMSLRLSETLGARPPQGEATCREPSLINGRNRPILLKNSVREVARATPRKPTSQIDPGSTIATSGRVK